MELGARSVRLLGIGVSNFATAAQGTLFEDPAEVHSPLDDAVDVIRRRFGSDIIKRGRMLGGDEE